MTGDRVDRLELLVRYVALPVLGDDIRVNDFADRRRGEVEAVLPCEASDVATEVAVGLGLAVAPDPEEETRDGRVLVLRRDGRPNRLQVVHHHLLHLRSEQHGLRDVLCLSLEIQRGRILYERRSRRGRQKWWQVERREEEQEEEKKEKKEEVMVMVRACS